MSDITVYSPEGEVSAPSIGLAAAPPSLEGVSIGILDNQKPNAGLFMNQVADWLVKTAGAKKGIVLQKNAALPAAEEDILRLSKEVQIVLTGSAD